MPGSNLSEPESGTLTFDEAKELLEKCYLELAQYKACQTDCNIRNFILLPDRKRLMTVDLEYMVVLTDEKLLNFHAVGYPQDLLGSYLRMQKCLRFDGLLEAA
uniref:Uncharacterized protein n=1 Tax=Bionectria ochroleuca TaxID=29856 RepID=A0A8H7NLV2_BIOOC